MISWVTSAWASATSRATSARRRGVPQVRISPTPMRSASNSLRKEAAISSNTGGRKRAGISSVPISNNNSFAMVILVLTVSYQLSAVSLCFAVRRLAPEPLRLFASAFLVVRFVVIKLMLWFFKLKADG